MAENWADSSYEVDSFNSNGDNDVFEERDEVSEHINLPRKASVLKKDGRGSKRSLSKSVSFSSRPEDKKIINAADCLTFMQNGCELMKIRSNSRQYQRFFAIDEDFSTLRWKPSSKKPEKAKISMDTVREIRSGKNTEIFREMDRDDIQEDCAFSIIYGDNFDTLNLVAYSPDEANIWVTGLRCLVDSEKAHSLVEQRQQMRDRWLKEQFVLADMGGKGRLNEIEVLTVLRQLKVQIPEVIVKQRFKEATAVSSAPQKNSLSREEFLSFYKELTTRPEIYFLLARYASNNDYLTTDDLLLFLESEQGITRAGKHYCLEIISRCEPTEEGRKKKCLGIDGFTQYLMESDCDIFDPDQQNICQDMTQPLSHYFIASSHNTYLLDNQLSGRSSIEGYIAALQQGCRCVELDCWDGPYDEPIIYHGHTLTSKIMFKETVEAIEEHAFDVSPYPVILSIENHCCVKQQQIMAKYLKEILKDKLYTEAPGEDETFLPSPEALKGRILIKNKKLPASIDNDEEAGEVSEEDEYVEENGVINGDYKYDRQNSRQGSIKRQSVKHDANKNPRKTTKLARELSDLVSLCKSVTFQDFQYSADNQKFWELCSLNEALARRLGNAYPEEFVNYNKRCLSRIYPSGKRVGSSNYNPQDMWNCGCQLVALNYQTPGIMMHVNSGKFLENGECGYVLKPSVMRDEIAYFNPNTKDAIPGISPQIVQIKVISGQQFPKPKGSTAKGDVIDPYVTIEVFGIPSDIAQERTRTVPHNGFNPVFDETFEFHINLPEIALFRFVVQDDDFIGDGFIGQYTIPLNCMQQGYRHLRLLAFDGDPLDSATLFVHVTITSINEAGQRQRKHSLRKSKKGREYTSMKTVGVKAVDETFKNAIQPLRDGADLRENLQTSLANFKEICGVAPRSNLKQCIRLLSSRLEPGPEGTTLELVLKDELYPYFEALGCVPEMMKKALLSMEQVVQDSKNLIENADSIYERVVHCQQAGMEWHEDLYNTCTKDGLKGKRLNKALESFAWNIRVLKGQAELLLAAKQECQDYLRQIHEASVASGLVRSLDSNL
ncbi:inactive phospholipase C-like protein 2 isoform X2 [Nematostella vectensis]|uniref:inactive phospholipase C-like protein 2 isoform X2 n=1 Tax=Nematostella vectensis TaxID=45351 RepID=UPI0020773A04|nr:inactive phospholipase C-like protein 2 isoform X2 [Nematostella vectensis]